MSAKSAEGAKRHPLNMRTTEATRIRLELEAKNSGRSLTQEVEFCIEQYYNNKDNLELLRKPIVQMIGLALRQSELNTGKSWHEDEVTAQQFRRSALSIIDMLYPFRTFSDALSQIEAPTTSAEELGLVLLDKFDGDERDHLLERLSASALVQDAMRRVKTEKGG